MKRCALWIGLAMFTLAACAAPTVSTGAAGRKGLSPLEGRTFISSDVRGQDLVAGSAVSLAFTEASLRADAGCNHIGGDARWDGTTLSVQALSMTEMGCSADLMAQDRWLAELLSSSPTMTWDAAALTLEAGDVVIVLAERADRELLATRWHVDGLIDGEVASSAPSGGSAWIQLSPDGQLTLDTGCNRGGGPAQVEGTQLVVGPLALTSQGCGEPEALIEQRLLQVLSGAVDYRVDGEALTLTSGEVGVTLRAAGEGSSAG